MLNANEVNEVALEVIPLLRCVFGRMGLPDDQIDDAVQDGYIHLVTYALPRWRGGGSAQGFACYTVRLRYLDTVKSAAGRGRRRHDSMDTPITSNNSDGGSSTHGEILADPRNIAMFERAIQIQALNVALESLTEQEQALCEAFRIHGKWKDAAEAIGVSAVKASRMRAQIREQLA